MMMMLVMVVMMMIIIIIMIESVEQRPGWTEHVWSARSHFYEPSTPCTSQCVPAQRVA